MDKLYYGAAFYPELWDEKTIEQDIKIMKETGINIVRIGEFMWSKLEPEEDKIDTSFLNSVMDKLYKNDIGVILCTPTAAPPIWLTFNHEERLHVNSKGQKMIHGSRQHVCTNNDYFRSRCRKIIKKMAQDLGNHPALKLWQLDNEFKCHISECYCDTCKEKWHEYLREKYGTIENLNEKWGTMVWSEYYQSFDQVPVPLENTPFIHHASLSTMYKIFHREKIAQFAKMQADVIREYSSVPISTNAALGFTTDNELLFKNLDEAGFDTYASHKTPHAFTINCDIFRNAKKDREYWLLETCESYTGALDRQGDVQPDGYITSEAIASYALGGKAFCYWLWRQQPYGSEINHSAILSAWGKEGLGYKNVIKTRDEIKKVEGFIKNTKCCKAEAAITYSDRAKAFMLTESHGKDNYRGLMTHFYENVLDSGVFRDLIFEGASLKDYKILFTPFMYYMSSDYLKKAKEFVSNGGIWIAGPLTGGRTENHTINLDAALGREFEDMAGIETLYTYPIENTGATGEAFNIKAPLKLWTSVFKLKEAKRVGIVHGGVTDNLPFITENNYGRGKVIMLGSLPYDAEGDELIKAMINHYVEEADLSFKYEASKGTIVVPREKDDEMYEVVINMTGDTGHYNIAHDYAYDILNKVEMKKSDIKIEPYGYKILEVR